ncbi:polyketide synthase dehydratase domain-containing protein, partial [Paractinoplanes brasiliensis]
AGTWLPVLRRDRDEPQAALTALAGVHVHGGKVDWAAILGEGPARPVDSLPAYPFQHERYWPRTSGGWGGDVGALGLSSADHPLVGAAVWPADGDGVVLTGRLSLAAQPWLADHAVFGSVLLPGTAFVEMLVWAADQVGCAVVDELTLPTPLVIPAHGGAQVQIWVGDADDSGRRPVNVYSRREQSDAPWTRHATGVLTPEPVPATDPLTWPPSDAEPVDLTGLYPRLEQRGYGYGPAFRGLKALWKSATEVYAEVALPDQTEAESFGLHPALLDAATHAIGAGGLVEPGRALLPFAWNGVRLHASGAATLRVRLTPHEDTADAVRVAAFDPAGQPVLTAEALVLRELAATSAADPAAGTAQSLYTVELFPVPGATGPAETGGTQVTVWSPPTSEDTDVAAGVSAAVVATLARVQEWLADPATTESRLVVLTR